MAFENKKNFVIACNQNVYTSTLENYLEYKTKLSGLSILFDIRNVGLFIWWDLSITHLPRKI